MGDPMSWFDTVDALECCGKTYPRQTMNSKGPRTVVRITRAAFDKLPEYSTSLPSGIRVGKQFKAKRAWNRPDGTWWRGTYCAPDDPEKGLPIAWDRIEVAEDGTGPEHITSSDKWSDLPRPDETVPEFERASGMCRCVDCGQPFRRHPVSTAWWWLTELCDGSLVKL